MQWHQKPDNGGEVFVIQGELDESAGRLLQNTRAAIGDLPKVRLDIGGVRRISSLGVRSWIEFVRSLSGREVTYLRCSPVLVEQLNSVRGFRGHVTVDSVLGPYLCERCDKVSYEELRIGRDLPKNTTIEEAPMRRCPTCGAPMTFDDMPTRFFQFVVHL
jgi:ABC-type transporter Mla MlaB component